MPFHSCLSTPSLLLHSPLLSSPLHLTAGGRGGAGGRKYVFPEGVGGRERGGRFDCTTRAGEAQTWETGINNAAPQERLESVEINSLLPETLSALSNLTMICRLRHFCKLLSLFSWFAIYFVWWKTKLVTQLELKKRLIKHHLAKAKQWLPTGFTGNCVVIAQLKKIFNFMHPEKISPLVWLLS